MKIRLRQKIIGLAILSALIPVAALLLMILSQQEKLVKRFDDDFKLLVDKDLTDSVNNLWSMCYAVHEIVESKVHTNIRVAQQLLYEWGPVSLSDQTITWKAENQHTKEFYLIELPKIVIGNHVIEQNFNEAVPTPIVDDIRGLTKEVVSLFQRINEDGDMLRIATTLLKPDGSRDISQYLEVNHSNMDPDQTIHRVLKGETVMSSINLLGEWYIFGAAPLRESATGKIIGMIRTAMNEGSLLNLEKALNNISMGINGFVWVVRGHAKPDVDFFVYPKMAEQDYVELSHIVQEKGLHFFENIKRNATKAIPGQILTQTFEMQDPRTHRPRVAVIKYTYFPQWDWVIGLLACEENYISIHHKLREPFHFLVHAIVWAVIIGLSMVIFLSFFLSGKIAKPIADLTQIAATVADGDLSAASVMVEKAAFENAIDEAHAVHYDETGQLFDAIRRMIMNLNSLILKVKQTTGQLVSSAAYITDTAKVQEGAVCNFKESASEIARAVNKISTTAQQLFQTMCNVAEVANESGKMADEGRNQLTGMELNMQALAKATAAISNKLTIIHQKAANINSIILTVGKVADQADVLSVNASIEAEKAGEYGRGFNIVARQIGMLAEQTSLATDDIQQMVKEMNGAIMVAIQEMERFSNDVSSSVSEVNRLGNRLQNIIEQVQVLSPRFDSVKEGMESQSEGAKKINQAMLSLTDIAKLTADSLENFEQAKGSLSHAIDGLRTEVSEFEVVDTMSKVNSIRGGTLITTNAIELN